MNIQVLYTKIERLRSELANEYEKCFEKGEVNLKVIDISQRLDQLILHYMKISKADSGNQLLENSENEIA